MQVFLYNCIAVQTLQSCCISAKCWLQEGQPVNCLLEFELLYQPLVHCR